MTAKTLTLATCITIFVFTSLVMFSVTRKDPEKKEDFLEPETYDFERSLGRVYKKSAYRLYPADLNVTRELLGKLIGENHTDHGKLKHPSLYIKKFCRFGNNILELSNAIYFAEIFNVSKIYIEKNFCLINNSIVTSKGIEIIPTEQIPQESLVLERLALKMAYKKYYPENRAYEFAEETLKSIPKVDIDKHGLYIHIRSGDVFDKKPNPHYGQPPLCYYESIIVTWNFKNVYVIAEDTKNPVVGELIRKYDAKLIMTDLLQTIGYIVNAKNVVMSFGTFVPSLLRLAPDDPEKRLFRYGGVESYLADAWKNHYFTNISDFYMKSIIRGKWKNTEEQRQIMLNETCGEEWRFFVYTNKED